MCGRFAAFALIWSHFAVSFIKLGGVLLRSALIGGHCAAVCSDLVLILQQIAAVLLRPAIISGPFCCVLYQFGGVVLRSALIWCHFAAFCIILMSFCCILRRLLIL